jgi:membrane glycosyltransferase
MKKFLKYFANACVLLSCCANAMLCAFLVAEALRRYPNPNTEYDPMGLMAVPIATTVAIAIAYLTRRWLQVSVVLWLSAVVSLLSVNVFNLLVPHNSWVGRGMPNWGEFMPRENREFR